MTWEEFASKVRTYQRGFMGAPHESRPGRGEFHENPSTCICEDTEAKARGDAETHNAVNIDQTRSRDEPPDGQNDEDEPDFFELDDDEDQLGLHGRIQFNETVFDNDNNSDEPELEEMLSD